MNIACADALMGIFGLKRELCRQRTTKRLAADVCRCLEDQCPEKLDCTRYTQQRGYYTPTHPSMRLIK